MDVKRTSQSRIARLFWRHCYCSVLLGLSIGDLRGGEPWAGNSPIVRVAKEIYQPIPKPDTILWCWTYYVGPGLDRVEYYYDEMANGDDVHANPRQRFSSDNGRTWTPMQPLADNFADVPRARIMSDRVPRVFYDAKAGVTLKISDHAVLVDKRTWYHHTNYFVSLDNGRTYGPPKPFRYEPGGKPFDPANPLAEEYLTSNCCAEGNNIVQLEDGTIVHVLQVLVASKDKKGRVRYRTNALPVTGKWDAAAKDYRWALSEMISVPPSVSPLGIGEPELATLRDGRVLVVWRTDAGQKFFSVSSDGAKTFSEPGQLRYVDGRVAHSPSSIAFMLRHSVTKKLYWLGNLCGEPPKRKDPRYPLVIAEIDEDIPAIKKNTITVIDTRQEGESEIMQLSNFSLLENRETHEIEVFVSPWGTNPKSMYEAPVRCYRLTMMPPDHQKSGNAQKSLRTRLLVYQDEQGIEKPVSSKADWNRRRKEILKGMQLVMGELPDRSKLPPLDVQVTETVEEPRFRRQTITFAAGESNRVPAYLYLPKGRSESKRVPALLAFHETDKKGKREVDGQGKADQKYGRELAERGYVVLAPDYPSLGDFKCDFSDPRFVSGTIHGIFNHMRAVDLLQSRPEVDRERIGAIGHSLGGHNSIFLGAFDPRVKVIVSNCGWGTFHDDPAKVKDWTGPRYMARLRDVYGLDPARIPFDFYEIVAALAPRPFLSISPTGDHDFAVAGVRKAIPAAREVYELFGAADNLESRHPDCGHGFPDEERKAAYEFLDRHLQGVVPSN